MINHAQRNKHTYGIAIASLFAVIVFAILQQF